MYLLTTEELRAFLRLKTTSAAKKLATRIGVKPIYFGPGSGHGDRWIREEVEKALLLLRDGIPKSQAEQKKRPKSKFKGYFEGPYKPPKGK